MQWDDIMDIAEEAHDRSFLGHSFAAQRGQEQAMHLIDTAIGYAAGLGIDLVEIIENTWPGQYTWWFRRYRM
jgi:hypothetical protein